MRGKILITEFRLEGMVFEIWKSERKQDFTITQDGGVFDSKRTLKEAFEVCADWAEEFSSNHYVSEAL